MTLLNKLKPIFAALMLGVLGAASAASFTLRVPLKGLHPAAPGGAVQTPGSLSLSGNSQAFGSVQTGQVSTSAAFTVSNTGETNTTGLALTPPAGFAVLGSTCGTYLAAGGSCSFQVQFAPVLAQAYAGNVVVSSSAGTQNVAVSGTGIAPSVSSSVATLSFPTTMIGSTSPAQSVTLTNNGIGPVSVGTITTTGAYTATHNCPASLAAGGSCTINVTFTPTTTLATTETLAIPNSAGDVSVSLTGSGKANIITVGSTRSWSDGSYAASCLAYLTGDANHVYSGATGNGVYHIVASGNSNDVYCDMTNGGWTLLAVGSAGIGPFTGGSNWYNATGAFNVPASPSPTVGTATWKYSDTFINAVGKSAFKLTGSGAYNGTWYASGSCVYAHNTTVSGGCAKIYSDVNLTTLLRTGNQGGGISDNNGSGYHIMTNNSAGYASSGWCVGNGSSGGGCGNAGLGTNFVMWAR